MTDFVSSILRRSPFFILPVLLFCLLIGCSSSDSALPDYTATIAEAKAAVSEAMAECNASAITVAVVDDKRIIWTESREYDGTGRAGRRPCSASVPSARCLPLSP